MALNDIVASLAAAYDANYVGMWTMSSETSCCLYVSEADKDILARELSTIQLDLFSRYSVQAEEDSAWSKYFDLMLIDPLAYESAINQITLETLVRCGDDPSVGRRVTHYALIRDPMLVPAASALLRHFGFAVGRPVNTRSDEESSNKPQWELTFSRYEESVSLAAMNQVCSEVIGIVLACNGRYMGWNTILLTGSSTQHATKQASPT